MSITNSTNVVETNIAPSPSEYEAYLYKFVNLFNNKIYLGIHKGAVDDTYMHSSTNDEFNEVFADSDSDLQFDVLQYGTYADMQNEEHRALTKVDARNNPLYYNKTNGFPAYTTPDLDKCLRFVEDLEAGKYRVEPELISELIDLPYIQSRFTDDEVLQRKIRDRINNKNGNTDKCNPILVYEGRGDNGEDMRGDGNHTVKGAAQSKHATKLPVDRIPIEVNEKFTKTELYAIGDLRNKEAEIVFNSINKKDGIKYVIKTYEDGVPLDAQSNIDWLIAFGFVGSKSEGEVKAILDKANKIISTEDATATAAGSKLWKNYKQAPFHQEMKDVVDAYGQNKDMISVSCSSGNFNVNTILEKMYAGLMIRKTIVMVVIHHPDALAEAAWPKIKAKWEKNFKTVLRADLQVQFHEMESMI